MLTFICWRNNHPHEAVTKVNIATILKILLEYEMMIAIKNGLWAMGLYPFNKNAVDCSKCKCHFIKNVSTGTACNVAPNAALLNLSIEDFHEVVVENEMKKFENTQQPPSKEVEVLRGLYQFQEKESNIQTMSTETTTDSTEEE